MTTNRHNQRHSPTDLDDVPFKPAPVREFDIQRLNVAMKPPWPEKYFGQRFGPSLIKHAQDVGFYVMAEIEGFPKAVVIEKARWDKAGTFEVLTAEGYRIPERIYTLATLEGYKL